jgi:hypothetical protein
VRTRGPAPKLAGITRAVDDRWIRTPEKLHRARLVPLEILERALPKQPFRRDVSVQPPSLKINKKMAKPFSFNHGVEGSSPSALTNEIRHYLHFCGRIADDPGPGYGPGTLN